MGNLGYLLAYMETPLLGQQIYYLGILDKQIIFACALSFFFIKALEKI